MRIPPKPIVAVLPFILAPCASSGPSNSEPTEIRLENVQVRYEVECAGECQVVHSGPGGSTTERVNGDWFTQVLAPRGTQLRLSASGTCNAIARLSVHIYVDGRLRRTEHRTATTGYKSLGVTDLYTI